MHSAIRTSALKLSALMLTALSFAAVSAAQAPSVTVAIDASKTGASISKYIYGQFLEHGGNIVNEGVWADMLEDRKFFNPVTSKVVEQPVGPGGWRRPPLRHWAPVGGDEAVTLDSKNPYTGDHSPLVKLSKAEAHGVQQAGLVVRKDKTYTGRIVLAGTPGSIVKVTLVWGKEANQRQTVTIPSLGAEYRKFPLKFEATGDSDDA